MMKRAFVKSNPHDDAKMQSKYQGLLQDYLELQKEFVAKKKKLRSVIVKRDTLLGEVSFLRRRHKQLLKAKSVTPLALDYDQPHLPSSKGKFVESHRKLSADDTTLKD